MDERAAFEGKRPPKATAMAPRWLLAKEISSLGFGMADPAQCPEFSISNIQLWQRTSVDKLPK
jgi:hypothetical protein